MTQKGSEQFILMVYMFQYFMKLEHEGLDYEETPNAHIRNTTCI